MRKIRKVLLITPPYHSGVVESAGTWLNLAFVYLAGSLRKAGYDPVIYDAMSYRHTFKEIEQRIRTESPDVVASTAITASVVDALEILRLTKNIAPQTITIIGNVHPTFCYEEILRDHNDIVDAVVRGEGEETMVELLDALSAAREPSDVKGLAYWKNGRVVTTGQRELIQDLDQLPLAWDLVDWSIYTYKPVNNSILAIVSSSRGCLRQCRFCSQQLFWRKMWRGKTPEHFVSELEYLKKTFGVNVAMIADETPTCSRERWEKILDLLIERNVGVDLLMETRVDDILRDEDILWKYKKARIEHIYVGVEAGDQALLDIFKKETKVEQSRRALELINQADIVTETSFVLGMPEDTPESIGAAVDLAIEYNPDMAFFLAIAPWPYAEIYPQLKEYVATNDYRKYNLVEPVVQPKRMSMEQLKEELGRAAMRFYAHRMKTLSALTPWKQEFMKKVFAILVNDSYLAGQMRAMMKTGGARMPQELEALCRQAGPYPATGNPKRQCPFRKQRPESEIVTS